MLFCYFILVAVQLRPQKCTLRHFVTLLAWISIMEQWCSFSWFKAWIMTQGQRPQLYQESPPSPFPPPHASLFIVYSMFLQPWEDISKIAFCLTYSRHVLYLANTFILSVCTVSSHMPPSMTVYICLYKYICEWVFTYVCIIGLWRQQGSHEAD